MAARLGVKGDVRGASFGEIGDDPVDGLDHQVHVDGRLDAVVAQRLANERPDRQVGDEMVVHHVEVHDIGAGRQHGPHVVTEASKVG